ncbi:MAG: hypothetical protein ACXADB_12595, partial [Candidatus Hermodarchaeia archaeon]
MKKCSVCGELKDLNQFYKSKSTKDGLQHKCGACTCAQVAEWRKKNVDRAKKYDRDRYRKKVGPPKPKMTK